MTEKMVFCIVGGVVAVSAIIGYVLNSWCEYKTVAAYAEANAKWEKIDQQFRDGFYMEDE